MHLMWVLQFNFYMLFFFQSTRFEDQSTCYTYLLSQSSQPLLEANLVYTYDISDNLSNLLGAICLVYMFYTVYGKVQCYICLLFQSALPFGRCYRVLQ